MRAGMASERSGESFGSMAMILTDGFFSLRYWPTPEMVPTGTDTCQEDVDGTVCIFVDFRTRRQAMNFRVDGVGELAGNEGIGNFFGQFVGFIDGTCMPVFPGVKTISAP